jgi:hypothetical protein
VVKITERESKMVVSRSRKRRNGELVLMETEFQFERMESSENGQ